MSERKVSRQRAWQLRKLAQGLCIRCGRGKLVTRNHCEPCRVAHIADTTKYKRELVDSTRRSA